MIRPPEGQASTRASFSGECRGPIQGFAYGRTLLPAVDVPYSLLTVSLDVVVVAQRLGARPRRMVQDGFGEVRWVIVFILRLYRDRLYYGGP